MPKSVAINEQSGRRKAKVRQKERGMVMQMLVRSPKDTLAVTLALAAVLAIAINAMFLQAGRHPSPLFGSTVPLPKPTASTPATQQAAAAQATATPAPLVAAPASVPAVSPMPRPRPAEAEIKPGDPLGNLVRATSGPIPANVARPPAPVPAAAPARDPLANLIGSAQKVAAVQRALTDYGYGQLKATGTVGPETQTAIQKFERERKLPVTGQMSERLVRELGLATGRNFD